MKSSLFVLALLLAAPAEGMRLRGQKKGTISIDISKTAYQPERLSLAETAQPASEEFNMMLDEAFSFHKGSYQSLLQSSEW
jgi:hypothetical protein